MQITIHTPKKIEVKITLAKHHSGVALNCEIPSLKLTGRAFAVHPLKVPTNGATHYLDMSPRALGLDAANAQIVRDAMAAFQEAYRQSPEGRHEALRKERRDLKDEIAGWWDAMDHAKERTFSTGVGWEHVRKYQAKVEAAKERLAAFDAAHPEMIAEIKQEQGVASARFLAHD